MYFAIAAVSVILNFGTVFSYKFGVDKANVASYVTSTFSWVIMLGNLIVWSVAAGMYRGEKDKNGKSNDLWGWTCSAAARAIQKEFADDVNFDRFCNVQVCFLRLVMLRPGRKANKVLEYQLVHWSRAGWRCAIDGDHLYLGVHAQEVEEVFQSALGIEWI